MWGIGLLIATATLGGLAFLVTEGAPDEMWGPLDELLATATMKGPTITIVVVVFTAMALCFRQLWLEWLALSPGPIEVETFKAGSRLADTDCEQLTLAFRQRFAELHLQAPASVPGVLTGGDFLDVLGRSGVDSRNWLASGVALLRAAKPRHAWQVSGVLVQRDQRPRFGLTIQVLRLPDGGNPPETMWANNWDEAVHRGADHATAAILPRTRLCRRQWAAWRRYRMRGELLGAYEDAVELEAHRRYDEALDAFYRASERDPMNMGVRLRIGHLQEKLGLYLDAFTTYQGMLAVGEERSVRRRTREVRRARRERRRAVFVARYRRIVLLGGSELAEQWRKTATLGEWVSERDERRITLRERLRGQLEEELAAAARSHPTVPFGAPISWWQLVRGARGRSRRGSEDPGALLREPPRQPDWSARRADDPARKAAEELEERTLFQIRELFALAALKDLRGLQREIASHRSYRKQTLSWESARLTGRCIEVRLAWIQYILAGRRSDVWPPIPEQLDKQVADIERNRRFDRWHEHYNAACLYALALMADDLTPRSGGLTADDLRDVLAERAGTRLASATAHADSAYIAGRRDWLLSEDPDLDGLRTHRLFKDFEAMNFPAPTMTPIRPRYVQTLESARYVDAVLVGAAECWEGEWHARGRRLDHHPDVHELLAWWEDEREAWNLVRRVALNSRHWPARMELLRSLADRAGAYGFSPPEISFPRYAEKVLTEKELGRYRVFPALEIAQRAERRLRDIGTSVRDPHAGQPARPEIAHIERWQSTLRELDTRGREPRRFLLAHLCDHHAALWQLLQNWLNAEIGFDQMERGAFKEQMARSDEVWCGANPWWRTPVLVRAAARGGVRPAAALGRRFVNGRNLTAVG